MGQGDGVYGPRGREDGDGKACRLPGWLRRSDSRGGADRGRRSHRLGLASLAAALALGACTPSGGDGSAGRGGAPNTAAIPPDTSASASAPSAPAFSTDLALPPPGSYTLDPIMPVPHGAVLDSDGSAHRLADYTRGRVTVFSFMYTVCSDARGCPLALATLHTLKAAIAQDPLLRQQVRLVSMSFDPAYDTPAVMKSYGGSDGAATALPRWYFLTSQSPRQLAPLLEGFGQDLRSAGAIGDGGSERGSEGGNGANSGADQPSRAQLSHQLKIYLIDRRGVVREIYSPAFLQPATMLADIRSLAGEGAGRDRTLAASEPSRRALPPSGQRARTTALPAP